jgi:H/ACA ribonucleoprotein complex subunit 4
MADLPFEKVKRELVVKKKSTTDPKFGCNPEERSVEELLNYGIINVDKVSGPTSHQVSAYVQQILGIKKSGHSGTLDPKVTGVLPTAIGRATRIVQLLLTAGKEYVAVMHLHKEVEEEKIIEACNQFIGKIKQLPPVRSAIKRQVRERSVYYLEILEIHGQEVLFKMGCQAGTYVRKICHDLGKSLGCGAHMAALRRTKAGCFTEEGLVTLHDLKDALWFYKNEKNEKYIRHVIKPVEEAINHIAKVYVLDSAVETICHGSDVKIPGISKFETEIDEGDIVAVLTLKGELVAYGNAKMTSKDIFKQDKGIVVKVEKVFMLEGTYPKIEKKTI